MCFFMESDKAVIETAKNILDYLSLRQKVVASNVANINTPGYKTRDISFADVMKAKNEDLKIKLRRTNPMHFKVPGEDGIGGLNVEPFYAYHPANPHDGVNDVDIDKELLKEGEIQANYKIFSQILTTKYKKIKSAITGTV